MKQNLEVPESKEKWWDSERFIWDQPFRDSRGTLQFFLLYLLLFFCISLTWTLMLWRSHSVTTEIREQKNSSPNTGVLKYCDEVQLCGCIDARWWLLWSLWTMVPVGCKGSDPVSRKINSWSKWSELFLVNFCKRLLMLRLGLIEYGCHDISKSIGFKSREKMDLNPTLLFLHAKFRCHWKFWLMEITVQI